MSGRVSTKRYVLSVAGALGVGAAPLGYRLELLPAGAAAGLLAVSLLLLCVLAACLLILLRGGRARLDLPTGAALALAAGVSAIPITTMFGAIGTAPIHDITTDTEDPPRFDAIVAVRGYSSNPIEYGGPEFAATQRATYPDIQPLQLAEDPGELADAALTVAEELGWQVVAVDSFGSESPAFGQRPAVPSRGVLIEATDTSLWFGFKDDVAVRLRGDHGAAGVTTVDVRSISRVGIADLGANAARIRKFLDRLKAIVG